MLGKDSQAYSQIQGCLLPLMSGVVVAVDPSVGSTSSQPGWAVYIQGELRASGTFSINPELPIWERLRILAYSMRKLYQEWDPDVLVYEDILAQAKGGNRNAGGHASLLKAVGAILSISGPDHCVGLYPISWKRMARTTYVKGDENDAIEIGWIAIEEAKRISEKDPPRSYGEKAKKRPTGPRKARSGADLP